MQSDSARQLALQKDNLNQLGLELREVNRDEQQAREALQHSKAELDGQRKSIKSLENDLRRTQADIERVSIELDSFEGVDDRLVQLRTDLETTRAEEVQLGNQYGNMRLAKRDLGAKADAAKRKLDAARDEERDFSKPR